jgi:predicted secreted protein
MLKVAMPSFTATQKQIRVKVDLPFQIRLNVTSGTGYSWQPQGPLPPGVTLLGVFQHPSAKVLPGGPGQEIMVFRAHDVGIEHVTLQYVRAWERAAKPVKIAAFTVTVRK